MRRATQEQVKTTGEIAKAAESMRRGAATTARALAEQATAGEQISRAAVELQRMVATVTKAMTEQAAGMKEIAGAATACARNRSRRRGRWPIRRGPCAR